MPNAGLRAASLQSPRARGLLLNLGEAPAWQAQIEAAANAGLGAQARAAYDRACTRSFARPRQPP